MIKLNQLAPIIILICLLSCKANNTNVFEILTSSQQAQFASEHICRAIQGLETTTRTQVVLKIDTTLKEQAYTINKENKKIVVSGGDETGLMYGGLELAEMIVVENRIPELEETVSGIPYIKRRGLKFN
uniref:hypothetical protein n=1 Tax=Draconibacterium sp. TaxID=1965318 RepID=UPI0035675CCE